MGLGRNALEEGGGRIVEKAGFTRDPPEPITDINRMQRDLGMTGPTRRARFAEVTGMAGQIPNRWLGKGVEGRAKEDWEEDDGRLPNPARGVGRRGRQTLENVDTGMGEQLPSLNLHHANMALESAHVPQISTIAQNEHAHRMPWSMHYLDRTGTVGGGAMAFPPRAVASETSTVKDCKRRFNHRGILLMLVQACLSTVKLCKHSFNHRGSLLKLVHAGLSTLKVCKLRFNHRGSLLKLVQACLSTVKVCKRPFSQSWKSSEARAGLFMYREGV